MANQTIGQVLGPVLLRALQQEQAPRVASDLETINEWRGVYPHADQGIVDHVVRRLGIEGAFTFEALSLIAGEYRAMERRHERTAAHNRAIRAYQENA